MLESRRISYKYVKANVQPNRRVENESCALKYDLCGIKIREALVSTSPPLYCQRFNGSENVRDQRVSQTSIEFNGFVLIWFVLFHLTFPLVLMYTEYHILHDDLRNANDGICDSANEIALKFSWLKAFLSISTQLICIRFRLTFTVAVFAFRWSNR